MADIGLAKLRHRGVHVIALALPAQQHVREPLGLQFRADVGERRRDAALIAEAGLRAGEKGVALRGDAAEAGALVAGDAVESNERLGDLLLVAELRLFRDGQHLRDERALLRRQVETRPRAGGFAEASATRGELGKSDGRGGGHLEIIVAVRAAEFRKLPAATRREFGVHFPRLEGRDRFLGNRQQRRGNRPAHKLRPFHFARELRLAARVEIGELQLVPAQREFRSAGKLLHAAPVARLLFDDRLAVHEQRAAVHFQEERVAPGVRDVDPAVVFDRRVMLRLAQTLQVKVLHVAGSLRRHLVARQPLPHLPAIQRVVQRPRHPRALQKEVRDALHVLPAQTQIRHPPGRSARMRLPQKIHEAFEAVLFLQRTQRNGSLCEQLRALLIARRMTRRASARMKQPLPLLRCDRIRRLQSEVVLFQRKQKVR